MTKAEKLARELVTLTSKYSESDFARAEEILASGELFRPIIRVSRKVPRGKTPKRNLPRPSRASTQESIHDLLTALPQGERDELEQFADRFVTRRVLATTGAARAFAQQAGIDLPKKLPPRGEIAKRLVVRLQEIPAYARSQFIEEAKRIGTESSLRRWSSLIVKDNDQAS